MTLIVMFLLQSLAIPVTITMVAVSVRLPVPVLIVTPGATDNAITAGQHNTLLLYLEPE